MTDDRQDIIESLQTLREKRRREVDRVLDRGWYVVLSVIFGMLTLAGLVAAAAVEPAVCSTCHSGEARYVASSSHKGIPCDACHVASGALGLVSQRASVISMIPAAIVPGRPSVSAEIDERRCLECHGSMMPKTITKNGVRMNHTGIGEDSISCAKCHGDAGHGKTSSVSGRYNMDMCLGCHSAQAKNLTSCDLCHDPGAEAVRTEGRTPWRVTHGANWKSTHGMGNLETCKACHGATYCQPCHGPAVPHPDRFVASHGRQVTDTGKQSCTTCHTPSMCDGCHGTEMPHPKGFLEGHSATVKADGKRACERCHDEASCESCHSRHIHPGIPEDKLRLLQKNLVSVQ